MKITRKNEGDRHIVVELEHGDMIQLTSPAGLSRTCIYIEVTPDGLLTLTGGVSIIKKISGFGISEKIEDRGEGQHEVLNGIEQHPLKVILLKLLEKEQTFRGTDRSPASLEINKLKTLIDGAADGDLPQLAEEVCLLSQFPPRRMYMAPDQDLLQLAAEVQRLRTRSKGIEAGAEGGQA